MSNDYVDLTDRFNEILDNYTVGEEGEHVVDLDAWATADLLDTLSIIEQVILLRGEEMPLRAVIDPETEEEYDGSMWPYED